MQTPSGERCSLPAGVARSRQERPSLRVEWVHNPFHAGAPIWLTDAAYTSYVRNGWIIVSMQQSHVPSGAFTRASYAESRTGITST